MDASTQTQAQAHTHTHRCGLVLKWLRKSNSFGVSGRRQATEWSVGRAHKSTLARRMGQRVARRLPRCHSRAASERFGECLHKAGDPHAHVELPARILCPTYSMHAIDLPDL